jgi:5-formyltetrahydrofolate cyclo-ligase
MSSQPSDISENKARLRNAIAAQRTQLTADQESDRSAAVFRLLRTLPEFVQAKSVLTYVSRENEVDTLRIIMERLGSRRHVVCPAIAGRDLVWREIRSLTDLHPGKFDILEPWENCTIVEPQALDSVVLVPGLAFTRQGARLGVGGGFFDRFLNDAHIFSIGLAYDFQIVDELPVQPHDIFMDIVVTESEVYRRSQA